MLRIFRTGLTLTWLDIVNNRRGTFLTRKRDPRLDGWAKSEPTEIKRCHDISLGKIPN